MDAVQIEAAIRRWPKAEPLLHMELTELALHLSKTLPPEDKHRGFEGPLRPRPAHGIDHDPGLLAAVMREPLQEGGLIGPEIAAQLDEIGGCIRPTPPPPPDSLDPGVKIKW